MKDWRSQFDFSQPFWDDFRAPLQRLQGPQFPDAVDLLRLLPDSLSSHGGHAIRFVAASELSPAEYERHIYTTGEVSTREDNWHDLFNALVWSRFPRLKVAMNAVHVEEHNSQDGNVRGKKRDALTLLDESGAIVVCADQNLLSSLARHDWLRIFQKGVFQPVSEGGQAKLRIFLCGHALLEKFLQPYKAITAQVLLVQLSAQAFSQERKGLRQSLDQVLADELRAGRLLDSPRSLSALPLMGIPGWWPYGTNKDYYADQKVFRVLREGVDPAPIINIQVPVVQAIPGRCHQEKTGLASSNKPAP